MEQWNLQGTLSAAVFCIALSSGLSGCSAQGSAAAQSQVPAATSSATDLPAVLATVGEDAITLDDIRELAGNELDQMELRFRRARHKLVEATLQDILRNRVLLAEAERQKRTVDQLLEAEAGGTLEPTEVEIASWYQENQERTGGRPLDQLKTQIVDYLRKERRDKAAEMLDQRLARERRVSVNLEPFRVTLNNEGAPSTGPASAAVTLVEFSDFECPFCGRFYPTLRQLEQAFGDKLRIIYRQYPIANIHPNAFKAAEASLCANEQGKFWELHDAMFQDQSRLGVRDLKLGAGRLGLNQKAFETCLDTGRYVEQIQQDLMEGARVGVTGTPALFVNGIPVDGGAVPFETVAKVIEKELQRTKR